MKKNVIKYLILVYLYLIYVINTTNNVTFSFININVDSFKTESCYSLFYHYNIIYLY